jgi:hypothetical protein
MNRVLSSAVVVAGLVFTLGGALSWGAPPPPLNDFSDGNGNTAGGTSALQQTNSNGYANTAFDATALFSNSSGAYNTASGYAALYTNLYGYGNTASGFQALNKNTSGAYNTAVGTRALLNTTTGLENLATGRAVI